MGKTLFKALHLILPFSFSNQRTRADNEYGTYLASCLKFAQDEASLNGLTHANTIGNKQTRTIRSDKTQHGSELIGNKVDTGSV